MSPGPHKDPPQGPADLRQPPGLASDPLFHDRAPRRSHGAAGQGGRARGTRPRGPGETARPRQLLGGQSQHLEERKTQGSRPCSGEGRRCLKLKVNRVPLGAIGCHRLRRGRCGDLAEDQFQLSEDHVTLQGTEGTDGRAPRPWVSGLARVPGAPSVPQLLPICYPAACTCQGLRAVPLRVTQDAGHMTPSSTDVGTVQHRPVDAHSLTLAVLTAMRVWLSGSGRVPVVCPSPPSSKLHLPKRQPFLLLHALPIYPVCDSDGPGSSLSGPHCVLWLTHTGAEVTTSFLCEPQVTSHHADGPHFVHLKTGNCTAGEFRLNKTFV